jgi:hypothetical protein
MMNQAIGQYLEFFVAAPGGLSQLLLRFLALLALEHPELDAELQTALPRTIRALALSDSKAAGHFCDDLVNLASGGRAARSRARVRCL